eukprot:5700972-Amphidinium_carterae.2
MAVVPRFCFYTLCGLDRITSGVWQSLLAHGFPVLALCRDEQSTWEVSQFAVDPKQPLAIIPEDAEITATDEGQHQEAEHIRKPARRSDDRSDARNIHASATPPRYLNVTFWGSRFQQLYRMGESPTFEAACKGLMRWIRCFGLMEAAVIDGGVEFKDKFAEQVDHLGEFTHCTDSYAPHQNGRTERAGAAVKEQLKLALETCEIGSLDELDSSY